MNEATFAETEFATYIARNAQLEMEVARLKEVIKAARGHLIAASNQKVGSPYARFEIESAFRKLHLALESEQR